MIKYSKWISLAAAIILAISSALPWTFHADVNKNFTGFFSENNTYGKPGKFLLTFAGLMLICSFIPRIWLKRAALFFGAINFAYALKTFLVYSSCYGGYCPEKKVGLWLMLFSTALMLISAAFPDMKLKDSEMTTTQPPSTERTNAADQKI